MNTRKPQFDLAAQLQEKLVAEQRRLHEFIEAQEDLIQSGHDIDLMMSKVVVYAERMTGATASIVEMIEGDEVVYKYATGTAAKFINLRLKINASFSGLSATLRETLICNDADTDGRVDVEICRALKKRSMIAVPIVRDGEILCILKVFSDQEFAFNDANVHVIELFGKLLASSMSQAKAFEAKQKALNSLRESEHRFRALVESSASGVVVHDGITILNANAAFARMFHYPEDSIPGLPFRQFFPNAPSIPTYENERTKAKIAVEQWVPTQLGNYILVETIGQACIFQGKPARIASVRDVTEQRRAQQRLEETSKSFQALFNSAPVPIVSLDENFRIKFWNPAAQILFGWAEHEVIGKFAPYIEEAQRPDAFLLLDKILAGEKVIEKQFPAKRRDGSPVLLSISSVLVEGQDSESKSIVAILADVTKAKQTEVALLSAREQAEKMARTKSEFLANMSHEIRTPLNAVLGMSELLYGTNLSGEQRSLARDIKTSADLLLNLVNDILDFSKIDAGRMTVESVEFDLDVYIQNSIRMFEPSAHVKNVALVCRANNLRQTHSIKGDPSRFQQILNNLIGNALKFTASGQVEVNVITARNDGDSTLRIEVVDTGIGINPEALKHLFKPFSQADSSTTRRFGGTGLGLSISKSLVEMMGGKIGVSSFENKGSTFWFELPLVFGGARATPALELTPSTPSLIMPASEPFPLEASLSHRHRLLLAEDNLINQRVASAILAKLGYDVHVVSNGKEALTALKQNHFDAILMDCQMPEMDGYEATQHIRLSQDSKIQAVQIIALTANAIAGDRERCLEIGMNDYVSKPIRTEELEKALCRTWERKSQGAKKYA